MLSIDHSCRKSISSHTQDHQFYTLSQRQIERIAMLKWQMNPSDYHFLCPQKWGNIGLTSAHNKIIENFICPIVRNVKGNALFIRLFLLLFRDIDLARVRPHFNPSASQKWEKRGSTCFFIPFQTKNQTFAATDAALAIS